VAIWSTDPRTTGQDRAPAAANQTGRAAAAGDPAVPASDPTTSRRPRLVRAAARRALAVGLATGMSLAAASAGVVLAPAPDAPTGQQGADGPLAAALAAAAAGDGVEVGAARVSLLPRPEDYAEEFPGATWLRGEENRAACTTLSPDTFSELASDPEHGAHLATATANPWPENPDCLYMGGFGLGPTNPILDWDLAPSDPGFVPDDDPQTGYGLWVRTVVVSDGEDEAVLSVIDAEGYLYEYATMCERARRPGCGARGIAERLGQELGFDPDGMVLAATHAHSSPDLIGGWGFVPDWYFAQVVDTIEASVRQAFADLRPAVIEVGEERARGFNSERRDTYRSAEEQQIAWFRAVEATGEGQGRPETIATVGAYAAHPTSYGTNGGRAHADWVGVFERRLEDRFGGVGLHLMTGLGNLSNRTGRTGSTALADLLPEVGGGRPLTGVDVRAEAATWDQPVTNAPLTALGLPGFFDRSFRTTPASITTGKSPDTAPCTSASPTSVQLQASAIRIGEDLAISAAPGEVFANLTNTLKEQSPALVTMPLGQANDALGYMPQSFELNPVGQQGLGFVAGGVLVVNYEDSYSIDRCVGDMVLESTIDLLRGL
jgi:hypothetical protein